MSCIWRCIAGFYSAQEMVEPCLPCLNSSSCIVGQYIRKCNGLEGLVTQCSPCTTKPAMLSMTVYTGPGRDTTYADDCPWGCNAGYFRAYSSCYVCRPWSSCLAGTYPKGSETGDCYSLAGATAAPSCTPCAAITNATFTGVGQPNDEQSCPFQCNAGYYRPTPTSRSCMRCTTTCERSNDPPYGYSLVACTPTSNAQCVPCSNTALTAQTDVYGIGLYYTDPNSCADFYCTGQAQLTSDGKCTICPAGSSKADGGGAGKCEMCDQLHYNPSPGFTCKAVPAYAVSTSDRLDWECNAGYYRVEASPYGTPAHCERCPALAAAALSVTYATPNRCTLSGWLCAADFFRDFNVTNASTLGGCSSCSLYAVPDSSPDDRTAGLADCPTCLSQPNKMEYVNAECPVQCNAGFYYRDSSANTTTRPSCVQCAPLTCAAGFILQLCVNGQLNNTCYACSNTLNTGQIYDPDRPGECVKICKKGYYKPYQDYCIRCDYGKYKPTTGNSQCLACPAGKYNSVTGSASCTGCPAGKYCSIPGCTPQCPSCPAGTFAATTGNSACQPCSETSIASTYGMSACKQCPLLKPFADASRKTCVLPTPPCPEGFFQPATACVPCLTGAYCPGGSAPPVKCPYDTPYSPRVAKTLADCAVLPATIPTAYRATACPLNTRALGSNEAVINSTLQCESLPGYYAALSPADQSTTLFGTQCPVDHYCAGYGCTMPVPCPPSAVFAAAGSSDASQCTPTMPFPCRAGFYKYEGYYVFPWLSPYCTECPVGFVCAGGDTPPSLCPDASSKYWSPPRSTSAAACTFDPGYDVLEAPAPCLDNSLAPLALDGTRPNVISYLQCRTSAGYFTWAYDYRAMDLPFPCPVGYYCPMAGATFLPIPCPPLDTPCLMGQYTIPEGRCPALGFAAPGTGCAECPPLPVNSFFLAAGDCAFCCAAGFYLEYYYDTTVTQWELTPLCMYLANWNEFGCTLSQYVLPTQACAEYPPPGCAECPPPPPTMAFPTKAAERPLLSSAGVAYGPETCAYVCAPGHYNNISGSC